MKDNNIKMDSRQEINEIPQYKSIGKKEKTYVRMIDDPGYYREIPQYKTVKRMLENVRNEPIYEKYVTFRKQYNKKYKGKKVSLPNMMWMNRNYKKLTQMVYDKYVNTTEYSDNSKSSYLNSLAKLLLFVNKSKFREYVRKIINDSKKYKKRTETVIKEKPNENYSDLQNLTKEYIQKYRNEKSRQNMADMLILLMNVYIPPMRNDISNMLIAYDKIPENTKDNYILIKGEKMYMIMNHDKVSDSKHHSDCKFKIDMDDEITYGKHKVTRSKVVKKYILDTLKEYPRDILLTNKRGDYPMGRYYYYARIKSILKLDKGGQGIFRRSYINHWYPLVSKKAQRQIAYRMRHSVNVAMNEYLTLNKLTKEPDKPSYENMDDEMKLEKKTTVKKVAVTPKKKVIKTAKRLAKIEEEPVKKVVRKFKPRNPSFSSLMSQF